MTQRHCFYCILSLFLLFIVSCEGDNGSGEGNVRELRTQIREAAADGTVDAQECAQLRKSSENYAATKDLDDEEWEAYILKVKPRSVESLAIQCSSTTSLAPATAPDNADSDCPIMPEKVNIYIENSGSMYAYLDKQSAFYGNMTDFVVQFDKLDQDFAYYLINDKTFAIDDLPGKHQSTAGTYGRKAHLESWLTPQKMGTKGDRSSSRIMEIINQISQETIADCEPRMLVSDYVYSITDNRNMEKEMAKVQSDMALIFNDVAKAGLATLVIKFESEFDGYYYPRNSPNKGYKFKGKRPYYCWMIARDEYIKKFPEAYTIERLPGYSAHAFISPQSTQQATYSIMPYTAGPKGRFQASPRGKGQKINKLVEVVPSSRTQNAALRLAIGVNFDHLITPPEYLVNTDNYRISGGDEDNWRVAEITDATQLDPQDRDRTTPEPSHLIVIEADGMTARQRDINIELLNNPPEWIINSHTDSDLEPEINSITGKTFGFRYLFDGVWDAYHPRRDELFFLTFPITLER